MTLIASTRYVDGIATQAGSPFSGGMPTSAGEFLRLLPADGFSCWVRQSSGLVGWGELVRLRASGPDRFTALHRQWETLLEGARIEDAVHARGSGPIAFGAIAFSDRSAAESVLIVPRIVLGRREGRVWMTTINRSAEEPGAMPSLRPTEIRPPAAAKARPGHLGARAWGELVARTAAALADPSGPEKAVLARDLVVHDERPLDPRYLLGRLNDSYPTCWTYFVDGLLGATPELLISVQTGRVESRILAGTHRATGDRSADVAAAKALFALAKDSREHRHAVDSLIASLTPHTVELHADPEPFLLELANVIHLATDARGTLAADADGRTPSSLEIAGSVHPTAAVGGTPRAEALDLLESSESMDRGRYAGPVGWIDARGDGQWGIALRGGQLEDAQTIRLFAGAGIMPESVPETEIVETAAKFAPMLAALGLDTADALR